MDEEKYIPIENDLSALDNTVKNSFMPYLKDLGTVLCVALILFLLCFRIAIVDGSSMKNTLIDGDIVLLANGAIAGKPKQGDIIVVNKLSHNGPIIKRVIATEGQKIDINPETGIVKVDGVAIKEPYISSATSVKENNITFPYIVEEGCVFVMGDNRVVSLDSRALSIGTIDCREIVGKALFLVIPGTDKGTQEREFDRIGALFK